MSPGAECLVWGDLALTLQVSRLVGVAPLRMTRERDGWRVSVSPTLCLYSYFFVFSLRGIALHTTFNSDETQARSLFVIITLTIESVFTLVITTLGVLNSHSRMDQMIDSLNIIKKIHLNSNKVVVDSSVQNKRCSYIAAVMCLVLVNVQHLAEVGLIMYRVINHSENVVIMCVYLCYYIEFLIFLLLEMQFAFLALLINSTLQFVNDSLDNITITNISVSETLNTNTITLAVKPSNIVINNLIFIDETATPAMNKNNDNYKNNDNFTILTLERAREQVQQLNLSFGAICDVINQVNETYGTMLFLLIGSFFLHLVENPYFFVTTLFSGNSELRMYDLVLQFSYCVLHFGYLILAVEPGHRTEREMDRTEVLISHLLRCVSSNDRLALELDLFYKQIALNNASYSPLGIFTLNRPLITAMCGGVTTYLVIIFQFHALEHL